MVEAALLEGQIMEASIWCFNVVCLSFWAHCSISVVMNVQGGIYELISGSLGSLSNLLKLFSNVRYGLGSELELKEDPSCSGLRIHLSVFHCVLC